MTEFLYHALGICGEHWHPNLINMSLIAMLVYVGTRSLIVKLKGK